MSKIEMQVINSDLLKTMPLPERGAEDKPRAKGAVLIALGSRHYPGSAMIAARAALRTGCPVYLAAPEDLLFQLGCSVPEVMPIPLSDSDVVGTDILKVVKKQIPAGSAACISGRVESHGARQELVDFDRIVMISSKQVETQPKPHGSGHKLPSNEDWFKQASEQDTTLAVLINGNGRAAVYAAKGCYEVEDNPCGDEIMGSSDVLAGIITGLLAQEMAAVSAAVWGVHLYTLALEAATKDFGEEGVTAGDMIRYIPGSIRYARRTQLPRKESTPTGFRRNL